MTLDQWLQEATSIFPAGVQARLAQEYRAHLEESVAAGKSGDPIEVFGKPKLVQRKLKRTYLQDKCFVDAPEKNWRLYTIWVILVILPYTFITHIPNSGAPVALLVLLSGWALLAIFTRKIGSIRRRSLHSYVYLLCLVFTSSFLYLKNHSDRGIAWVLCAVLIAVVVWPAARDDARIRRTLDVAGVEV